MKKHNAFRMCVVCKIRALQQNLHRFCVRENNLFVFEKNGRSVYICENCLVSDDKILQKSFAKACKNSNLKITQKHLKEIISNGKN